MREATTPGPWTRNQAETATVGRPAGRDLGSRHIRLHKLKAWLTRIRSVVPAYRHSIPLNVHPGAEERRGAGGGGC
jgi:hypothetical protein